MWDGPLDLFSLWGMENEYSVAVVGGRAGIYRTGYEKAARIVLLVCYAPLSSTKNAPMRSLIEPRLIALLSHVQPSSTHWRFGQSGKRASGLDALPEYSDLLSNFHRKTYSVYSISPVLSTHPPPLYNIIQGS